MKLLKSLVILVTSVIALQGSTAQAGGKSWYENFEIGYAIPNYDAANSASIDSIKAQGASSMPIGGGFGVYKPVIKENTLLGLAFHGVGDLYSAAGQSLVFIQAGAGLSLFQAFGSEPGSGLFVRADAGAGVLNVLATPASNTNNGWGPHALVGAGFGFNISSDIHMMFSTNYSARNINGTNFTVLDFMINFMR